MDYIILTERYYALVPKVTLKDDKWLLKVVNNKSRYLGINVLPLVAELFTLNIEPLLETSNNDPDM